MVYKPYSWTHQCSMNNLALGCYMCKIYCDTEACWRGGVFVVSGLQHK